MWESAGSIDSAGEGEAGTRFRSGDQDGGSAAAAAIHASLQRPVRKAYYSEIFSTLLRQRLALFRIAALPAGRNSYPEDIDAALKGAEFDSAREQELLYVQTEVMNRSENLSPLHARKSSLNYFSSTNYRELTGLVPYQREAGLEPERTAPLI